MKILSLTLFLLFAAQISSAEVIKQNIPKDATHIVFTAKIPTCDGQAIAAGYFGKKTLTPAFYGIETDKKNGPFDILNSKVVFCDDADKILEASALYELKGEKTLEFESSNFQEWTVKFKTDVSNQISQVGLK